MKRVQAICIIIVENLSPRLAALMNIFSDGVTVIYMYVYQHTHIPCDNTKH